MSTRKNTPRTTLIHSGRGENKPVKPVNPPIMRASTVLFETHASWIDTRKRRTSERLLSYGARGTDTTFELENLVTELEGGYRAQLCPTGLAALALVILNYARAGGHILIADCIYQPVKPFCDVYLRENDIQFDFIKPDGSDLEEKIRPNTQLLLCEVPGSLLYELADLPKLSSIAHAHNIPVAIDNTYGSSYCFTPLQHGADISIVAATKYLSGHSDVMLGMVICNEKEWANFSAIGATFGMTASPDDASLVLRGIRTLDVRMRAHQESALAFCDWLLRRSEVATVYYPALDSHPNHAIWKRDFNAANGLVTIEMKPEISMQETIRLVDGLQLFGIGASWGGYESLAVIINPQASRKTVDWSGRGPFVRFHIGLEDVGDLINDAEAAFSKMAG